MSHQSTEPTAGVSVSRRSVLKASALAGLVGVGGVALAQDGNTIELEGEVSGWVGVSPSGIEGETNPTLSLVPGEEYTLEWTNTDSLGHNFAIEDAEGDVIHSTDIITEGTQTVEFTASEEMAEYFCQPHPQSMRGEIELRGDDTGGETETEEENDDSGSEESGFTKTQLVSGLTDPMKLATAPDGRVFYTTRGGDFTAEEEGQTDHGTATVGVIDPDGDATTTAFELDVYVDQEDGLQGIAFDPAFEDNGWVYLYYSPPNDVVGDSPYNLLSRFTVEGDTITPSSEVEILKVPTQRETCCHVGGAIEFDAAGNLYLSTGDDTNPHQSDGFTPIDERAGRESFDAQRTAADTSDLRGKILRITPNDDGSYSIPANNLFTEEQGYGAEIENETVRPEIYVMGVRNPFSMTVDEETGWLHYADYGPDSGEWDADRGPLAIVEFTVVQEPHNAGWPYFVGPNIPYIDGRFQAGGGEDESPCFESSGEPFDPDAPTNNSPNNTGLAELPSPEPATIWYPSDWDAYLDAPDYANLPHGEDEIPWPNVSAGGGPMTGPVYRHEDSGDGTLPEAFDGKQFIMEWNRGWIKTVDYDENGEVADIQDFMPDETFRSPMAMELGPDGALYLMEWGAGFESTDESGIYRIEYQGSS